MSFLFPRTIRIDRPSHQAATGEGKAGYGGVDVDKLAVVVASAPASVQRKGTGRGNPANLPGDTTPFRWAILIPLAAGIAPGVIQDRDIVTDDLGRRFQVSADYSHSLGWTLDGERLET